MSFEHHRILEAQFGVCQAAQEKSCFTLKQLEEKQKELNAAIKQIKKLNGLGIKAEEKKMRLAVFASEERYTVRLARARRMERAKERGSV